MSKKLIFTTSPTTASKQYVLDNMRDLTFEMTASTPVIDLQMSTAEQAIEQSLKNLLNLQSGGNVLFPDKGAPLINMLFKSDINIQEQRTALLSFIATNEPRITVTDLNIKLVDNDFNERSAIITLSYSFMSSTNINNVTVTVLRDGK